MPDLSIVPAQPVTEENGGATFADFWLLFPKRVARMEAEKQWKRLSDVERVAALVGLIAWRPIWLASQDLTYVPHASTWIHQHRWEDELPATWGAGHLSHLEAKLPQTERSLMPEKVRAYLAKLRSK